MLKIVRHNNLVLNANLTNIATYIERYFNYFFMFYIMLSF